MKMPTTTTRTTTKQSLEPVELRSRLKTIPSLKKLSLRLKNYPFTSKTIAMLLKTIAMLLKTIAWH
jgi:hypothetical protein